MKQFNKLLNTASTKRYNVLLLLFPLLFLFNGCIKDLICINGEGEKITEIRELSGFSKIDLQIAANVFISQDDEAIITIEAQENVLDEIETRISGDVLILDYDHCVRRHDGVDIYITSPTIDGLKISGSGEIITETNIESDGMELIISGSGSINVDKLTTDYAKSVISGSGSIYISGTNTCNYHQVNISGSGDLHAYDFECNDTEIYIPGSGNCWVSVLNTLYVNISGSGDVMYKGNPVVNENITGSGNIFHQN